MDARICRHWLVHVFLPAARRFTQNPIILLWDGLSSHVVPDPVPAGVTFLSLPPGTTSVFQPLDQGVLNALKLKFRTKVLQKIVANMDTLASRQDAARTMRPGTAGLEHGVDANVADVCRIIRDIWDDFDQSAIANCFIKSNILPVQCVAELQKIPTVLDRPVLSIDDVCSSGWNKLGTCQLKVMEEVKVWLDTESDEDILRLAVDDAVANVVSSSNPVAGPVAGPVAEPVAEAPVPEPRVEPVAVPASSERHLSEGRNHQY